jgi:GNAT superfamily N-acetyltransferase
MKSNWEIKAMTAADIDAVSKVYREVLEPSYISYSELGDGKAHTPDRLTRQAAAIFRDQLASLWQSPERGFFVCKAGSQVIGFSLASLRQTEAGHGECWLDDVGVLHRWRRHGVARQLIGHVLEWGREAGAKYFLIESGWQNAGAHALFESLGFRPLSTVYWHPSTTAARNIACASHKKPSPW